MSERQVTRGGEVPEGLRPVPHAAEEARAELVVEGLWRLELPIPYGLGTVNAYALETADGWLLLDCGTALAPGWAGLEHALRLAGVPLGGIVEVVGTHAHLDHVGLAAELVERTGCTFALAGSPEPTVDVIREATVPLERRLELAIRAGTPEPELDRAVCHPAGDFLERRIEPDRLLVPDEVIATRAGRWRVIPAPGHAETQVLLFEERRRLLVTADLVYIGRLPYLEYDFTPDPYAEHLASLELAASLDAGLLLPGHGPPEADARERLAAAHGSLLRAKERIYAAVAERPHTPWELMLALLQPTHTTQMRQPALAGALCILEHLAARGEVVEEPGENGVRTFRATPS